MLAPALLSLCLVPDVGALKAQLETASAVESRLAALDDLAKLHQVGDPDRVTLIIAAALTDDAFTVRARAAKLLGDGLEEDPAVTALLGAAAVQPAEQARLVERFEDEAEAEVDLPLGKVVADLRRAQRLAQAASVFAGVVEGQAEVVEALTKRLEAYEPLLVEAEAQLAYRDALIEAIGQRRSVGATPALAGLLDSCSLIAEQGVILKGVDGLRLQATGPALEAIVGLFDRAEEVVDTRAKQRKKLAREKPRRKPREVKGAKEWKQLEERRIERAVSDHDKDTAKVAEVLAKIRERLARFAAKHDLPEPPTGDNTLRWRQWRKAALEVLPAEIE